MEKVYVIEAKLINGPTGKMPSVSRTIAVPEQFTLYSLAYEIVDSFNFYFDHCFGFYNHKGLARDSTEIYELFVDLEQAKELNREPFVGNPNASISGVYGSLLYNVFDKVGKKMYFLFDYGDGWIFELKFLRVEDKDRRKKYPRIVAKKNRAPKQYRTC